AARGNGAAGNGTPFCSTKTMRKTTNSPYETGIDWLGSSIPRLLRRPVRVCWGLFAWVSCRLIVPADRVQKCQYQSYREQYLHSIYCSSISRVICITIGIVS